MVAALLAGAAETDITPPLGTSLAGHFEDRLAHDVDDPLRAKALVLDDGEVRLALVALDLLGLPRRDVEAIRQLVSQHTGIPVEHVLIGCTHTHTGPATRDSHAVRRDESYCRWLVGRVADSVRLAVRRLRPARLAWGQGEQHDISFCRRYRMRDGTVRMNPGRGNPDIVAPTSPIDPVVGVLYVEDQAGAPLAVVARFSLHYVGTDDPLSISADYYGHFDRLMRQVLGQGCLPLLFNGNSGQINNINPFDPHQLSGHRQARRVALALGGEVLKVVGRLRPHDAVALGAAVAPVTLPRKRVTEQDLAVARAILEGDDPSPDRGPFSWVVGQPIPRNLRRIYAEHCLRLAELPATLASEVQVLRIGESAWVALPGEVFVEIGQAIMTSSPVRDTFVVGLANDNLGYLATDRALLEEGGYETWAGVGSPVGVGAERILVQTARELLQRLFPGARRDDAA